MTKMFEAYYRSSRDAETPQAPPCLCAFITIASECWLFLPSLSIYILVFFASRMQRQAEWDEVIDDDGVVRLSI